MRVVGNQLLYGRTVPVAGWDERIKLLGTFIFGCDDEWVNAWCKGLNKFLSFCCVMTMCEQLH